MWVPSGVTSLDLARAVVRSVPCCSAQHAHPLLGYPDFMKERSHPCPSQFVFLPHCPYGNFAPPWLPQEQQVTEHTSLSGPHSETGTSREQWLEPESLSEMRFCCSLFCLFVLLMLLLFLMFQKFGNRNASGIWNLLLCCLKICSEKGLLML